MSLQSAEHAQRTDGSPPGRGQPWEDESRESKRHSKEAQGTGPRKRDCLEPALDPRSQHRDVGLRLPRRDRSTSPPPVTGPTAFPFPGDPTPVSGQRGASASRFRFGHAQSPWRINATRSTCGAPFLRAPYRVPEYASRTPPFPLVRRPCEDPRYHLDQKEPPRRTHFFRYGRRRCRGGGFGVVGACAFWFRCGWDWPAVADDRFLTPLPEARVVDGG